MKGRIKHMTTHEQRGVERHEHKAGGEGHVLIEKLLNEQQMDGRCALYARVTLEPGCSIGYHEHTGNSETYYILSGTGRYSDNGVPMDVGAGDVTFTPSGSGHGLANTGGDNLEFMALIINS